MKCYPHNDYYRADEEDVVSKLLIATRPSKQDRGSFQPGPMN